MTKQTTIKTIPHAMPKPLFCGAWLTDRATSWRIDFRNGAVGEIFLPTETDLYDWTLRIRGDTSAMGSAFSRETAMVNLWCRAAQVSAPAPLAITQAEVQRRAEAAERGSPADAVRILRRLLRLRSGRAWSVRAERTSPNGAIRIMAMPARCTAGRMTMTDTAALAALCGRDFVTPSSGFRVSGEPGTRRRLVHTLAGIPETNVIAISRAQ